MQMFDLLLISWIRPHMPFLLKVYMNPYHADNALALAHVVFFPVRGPDVFFLSFFF